MNNPNEIPLMFQAQIRGRGQIQYAAESEKAQRWVREWVEAAQNQVPQFGTDVKTKTYKITWRFISNSGQDEDFIRPVIAGGGHPFYPGASMKGVFLRHCTPEQALRYCGGNITKNQTKTRILRFHGGYPQDESWRDRDLVDVVHPQQDWQIKNQSNHSAFVQISLHQPILIFGISSRVELDEEEWNTIWSIWEKALESGIGSRVSSGYGQPIKHVENKLVSIGLSGQGLASQLLNKTGEFRPNMFKAALRGHTLRLFAGVTDEATAEELTRELWGGFAGKNGAVVGNLGISFHAHDLYIGEYKYRNNIMPTYELNESDGGVLSILCMRQISANEKKNLTTLITSIFKFSLLLGGFGKSWRRVDHRLCFPDYTKNNHNPAIGCHWELTAKSKNFYFPVSDLSDITNFLNRLHNKTIKNWVKYRKKQLNHKINNWREVWHPEKVQVWGRFAEDIEDSQAVRWFHVPYQGEKSIKGSSLTGEIGKIGRIWHRMYPRHILEDKRLKRVRQEYIELLTIFPDESQTCKEFIDFLKTKSDFEKLW